MVWSGETAGRVEEKFEDAMWTALEHNLNRRDDQPNGREDGFDVTQRPE